MGLLRIQQNDTSSAHARLVAAKMGMVGEHLLVGRHKVSVSVRVSFGIEPLGV
ncbi:hypothetical protein WMF18_22065 [Sorangium sp. So ce315]|uniref:hypothetical protein n=1 Tax=Sorangium sp. So ce315 TaxID=3133299 RepID=UPI003F600382